VVGLADAQVRIGLASQSRPPGFEIAREGPGVDLAEAVGFGEVFDGDDGHKG